MLFAEGVGDTEHHRRGAGGRPCLSHDGTAGRFFFFQTPVCHCTGEIPEKSGTCSMVHGKVHLSVNGLMLQICQDRS